VNNLPNCPEHHPSSPDELAAIVAERAATEPAKAFAIVGAGTSFANSLATLGGQEILSTDRLHEVVDYPARDMTITVGAGVFVKTLDDQLRKENQRLPIEFADRERATIGGAMAVDAFGPGRFGHGSFRDYIIGVRAVDGVGRPFAAGGRVVKNVAGYDLCKLLTGSWGTLGVITEVTLKLRPMHEQRTLVAVSFADWPSVDTAVESLLHSQTRPISIDLLNPRAIQRLVITTGCDLPERKPLLIVSYEGGAREVDWQAEQLQREIAPLKPTQIVPLSVAQSQLLWSGMVSFSGTDGVDRHSSYAIEVSLLASQVTKFMQLASSGDVALIADAGCGTILADLPRGWFEQRDASDILAPLLRGAKACDATLRWTGDLPSTSHDERIGSPLRLTHELMRGMKQALDPKRLFNPYLTR